ncbi:hypothetical protein IQ250_01560 [Pseudanabaenaceae cyanobacterium LEGE 13415]|nr:hypothetical protein [Pseudanabaenaceae cyanobacterium LEGE 13415]
MTIVKVPKQYLIAEDQDSITIDLPESMVKQLQNAHSNPSLPESIEEFGTESIQIGGTDVVENDVPSAQDSKPTLGQRLRAIRAKIVESGEDLLTIEEIEQEIAEQRDRLEHLGE